MKKIIVASLLIMLINLSYAGECPNKKGIVCGKLINYTNLIAKQSGAPWLDGNVFSYSSQTVAAFGGTAFWEAYAGYMGYSYDLFDDKGNWINNCSVTASASGKATSSCHHGGINVGIKNDGNFHNQNYQIFTFLGGS